MGRTSPFPDTLFARRGDPVDGDIVRAERGIDKSLPFFCLGCGQELYAATEGKVQRPHFRHKGGGRCPHGESYIHWISKELFAEEYRKMESFTVHIRVEQKCARAEGPMCRRQLKGEIDLKKIYPRILVEAPFDRFRPDCRLFNDRGDTLFFEIFHTHASSDEKVASGIPIIELRVSGEGDIDEVLTRRELRLVKAFTRRRPGDLPEAKIHNEEALFETAGISPLFDCDGECVDPLSGIVPFSGSKPQKPISGHLARRRGKKRVELDFSNLPDDVSYLLRFRPGVHAAKEEIPFILGKMKEYYGRLLPEAGKRAGSRKAELLHREEGGLYLFFAFGGEGYAAARFEGRWHIYQCGGDGVRFLASVEGEDEIAPSIEKNG